MPGHLLHIGYTKSGSSFLQKWFEAHPELNYVHQSFGGFRTTVDLSEWVYTNNPSSIAYHVTSDEDYSFWKGPLDPIGLRLKPYPVKAHQIKVCQTLYDLFPHSKVLIIVRGFASVIRSAYSQYLRAGGELDFEHWLKAYRDLMVDFWDFDHLIAQYKRFFGESSLIVLPFEAMAESPADFLKALEKQLGIMPVEMETSKVNPAISPVRMAQYYRLNRRVAKLCDRLNRKQGIQLFNWYQGRLILGKWDSWLDRFPLSGKVPPMELTFPAGFLDHFRGKANSLAHLPEFQPYLSHYQLDEVTELRN